jgi:hypothetical protein
MVTVPDHYIEQLKEETRSLKEMLEPLESGRGKISHREPGGQWVDQTPTWINQLKRTIAMYEKIVETRNA